MPIKQLISYALWTAATAFATYYISVGMMDMSTYRSHELEHLIKADIKELSTRAELKNYFENIKFVDAIATDKISSVWASFIKTKIKEDAAGRYKLEMLFISQNDESLKAVVQYHFIDLTNGDSVEEFARYYDLKAFYD